MAVAAEALEGGAAGAEGGAAASQETVGFQHYQRLVAGGAAPGKQTFQRARQLANKQARPGPAPASKRERPATAAGQGARLGRSAARRVGEAPARALDAARRSGLTRSSAVSKLLTALLVGAIALEVLSFATGQYFLLDWQGLGQRPLRPQGADRSYAPLYQGQTQALAAIATGQAPASMAQQSQAAQLYHARTL